MIGSLAVVLLPGDPLNPLRKITQVFAPLQWATRTATNEVTDSLRDLATRPLSAERYRQLLEEKESLIYQNVSLRSQNRALLRQIDELTRLRDSGLPEEAVLIPARVIGLDAAPGRESFTIDKGGLHNVSRKDWVTSRIGISAGTEDGIEDRDMVIARQCLIGWVEQAAPFTSRVVLLSDRFASGPRKAYITPAVTTQPAEGEIPMHLVSLEGAGNGFMHIPDVPRDLVEAGLVSEGDFVLSAPDDVRLPFSLVIGRIERLVPNKEKPVCFDATVQHLFDPARVDDVFVANFSREAAAAQ